MKTEKTTPETITDEQIRALEAESAEAGDLEMVAICRRALGEDRYDVRGYVRHMRLRSDVVERHTKTIEDAWAECARVIADAEAMEG